MHPTLARIIHDYRITKEDQMVTKARNKMILCPGCSRHIRMHERAGTVSCPFCQHILVDRKRFIYRAFNWLMGALGLGLISIGCKAQERESVPQEVYGQPPQRLRGDSRSQSPPGSEQTTTRSLETKTNTHRAVDRAEGDNTRDRNIIAPPYGQPPLFPP